MTDNTTDAPTNATDVAEIEKKLENTTITTQTETSTNVAPIKESASLNTESNKEVISQSDVQNEETKIEENSSNNIDESQIEEEERVAVEKQADAKETEEDNTNLIINYLPPTMSEGTLATLFSPYGSMLRCKIVVDLVTLRSRGYGFVKYDNVVSAEKALQALNGIPLNGKKLKVAFARPQCKAITNANLYITNVPPHFSDSSLRKLFEGYGKIVECRVLMDQNGHSRGVGFVRMDTHHNAIAAIEALDKSVIDTKHPPLLVKLAQRRVPRRYWNNQNRNQHPQQQNRREQQNKKNKGRNSGRKYYPKGVPPMMGHSHPILHNRGSPSKQRGYYRPRQQYKQQNKSSSTSSSISSFPAPMYQQEAYGMATQQYGQQQYAANMLQINNASNPSNVDSYNVTVFNLPKHFNVDHIINMYAKFGPVQSVNIRNESAGPVGIISYFYFDDAQRAQNETNQLEIGNDGDTTRLETIFQAPVK